ncbi:glyoxalase/bleomycin resistance/extradiol dioxygenase family protein, partial [Mesorhizobium sp. M7A.F.Ca.US.006.01.1.1]|uniref:VOC family protein n=1 Tax=Mesorhizobium sp. M7A.F.Ca.US.006.01.1.1 TaxID=2496707 RepID=UPI000FCACC43
EILVVKSETPGLVSLAYELNPGTDVTVFAGDLRTAGFNPKLKSSPYPGIARLLAIETPCGHRLEFLETEEGLAAAFSGAGRREAGVAPIRLGHAAITSSKAAELIAFHRDVLGFWETDWIGDVATFLTCNCDHHVINIVNTPAHGAHHIAFQLRDAGHHAQAGDRLRAAGIRTEWGPTRHTAGHNIAAYHFDPDRTMIELYAEMDVFIPEAGACQPRPWHEHVPMKPKRWGLDELSAWGVDFRFDLAKGEQPPRATRF